MPAARLAIALATVVALLATASGAQAQWSSGQITGLGATQVTPRAVNSSGVVVGDAKDGSGDYVAFRWEDGVMTELPIPGGATSAIAWDLNDAGDVVGGIAWPSSCSTGQQQGIKWTTTATTASYTLLDYNLDRSSHPPEADCDSGTPGSMAYGINNHGLIVGSALGSYTDDHDVQRFQSFPATSNGAGWSKLFTPMAGGAVQGGSAHDVNDNGDVLGSAAFGPDRSFINNGSQILEQDSGYPSAQGLNDAGKAVGHTVGSSTSFHARLWNGSGYEEIGSGEPKSMATAINESDWVVGRSSANLGDGAHFGTGYLWRPTAPPTPLNSLAGGFSARTATDINDNGMVVGVGDFPEDSSFFVWSGFWMAPASAAYPLDGDVTDSSGAPVAGATVRIVRASGQTVTPAVKTNAAGHYETTLNPGNYEVTVLPEGSYAPDPASACVIEGTTCAIAVDQPRTVDFEGTGGPGGPGGDEDPPDVEASKKGKTKAGKPTKVKVVSNEAGEVVAQGTQKQTTRTRRHRAGSAVVIAGKKKIKVRLKRARAKLEAGKAAVLKLKPKGKRNKKLAKKLKKAVKHGAKAKAKLKLKVSDEAGNTTRKKLNLKLK